MIDIDTYRSPWKHWFALIRNARESLNVFLTIGLVKIDGGNADAALLDPLGPRFKTLKFRTRLWRGSARRGGGLHRAREISILTLPTAARRRTLARHARYIGVRLERKK